MRAGDFILKQSKLLLESKQHAILCAMLLSVIPFFSWLSVALVALITLRKGAQIGFEVLLPALVVHSVPLMTLISFDSALVNTLIAYLPCYLAAITLRKTASWPAVFGVYFLQTCIIFLMVQLLIPEFAFDQLLQIKEKILQYDTYQQTISMDILDSSFLAQILLGVHALSAIVSSIISLFFARNIQAKLFMPGGFKQELLNYKTGKYSFLAFMVVSITAYFEISWALNLLPMLFCYFLVWGLVSSSLILIKKKQTKIIFLLLSLMVVKPVVIVLAYVIFGLLDSLFQFKFYCLDKAQESI